MYSYLTDNEHSESKANDRKNYMIKWEIKFQNYKERLDINKAVLRSQKDLGVRHMMYLQKKQTNLPWVPMMIKEYWHMIE